MEGLELLAQARTAGLIVESHGTDLVVKGPKRAAAIALKLIKHKAAILAALDTGAAKSIDAIGSEQRRRPVLSEPAPCRVAKNGTQPTTITLNNKTYELRQFVGMWFFRLTPAAGWTCCSPEFVKIIENTTI